MFGLNSNSALKITFIFFFLVIAKAFSAESTVQRISVPNQPMRAVQVSVFEARDWRSGYIWLKGLKEIGFNTVIIRVFHNSGDNYHSMCVPLSRSGVYFKTDKLPLVCDWLGDFINLAHLAGLKVIAWMNTRYADYGLSTDPKIRVWSYDLREKRYFLARGISPLLPEVQSLLEEVFKELAGYPIDGILLQDDLILRHNEDFNPRVLWLYKKEMGVSLSPEILYLDVDESTGKKPLVRKYSDEFFRWSSWKSKKLLEFAYRLRESAKAKNPSLLFGLNFYYESFISPKNALSWYSQDLNEARNYPLDFYAIMLYHCQMGKELNLDFASIKELIRNSFEKNKHFFIDGQGLLIKLQLRDFDTGKTVPAEELEQIIGLIPALQKTAVAFFPVSARNDLKSIMKRVEMK